MLRRKLLNTSIALVLTRCVLLVNTLNKKLQNLTQVLTATTSENVAMGLFVYNSTNICLLANVKSQLHQHLLPILLLPHPLNVFTRIKSVAMKELVFHLKNVATKRTNVVLNMKELKEVL